MHKQTSIPLPEELKCSYHSANASVVFSASGLAQVATLPVESDADKVAALSAATITWAAKLARGSIEQVFLKAAGNCVLLNSAENGKDSMAVVRSCAKCKESQAASHCINAMLDGSLY